MQYKKIMQKVEEISAENPLRKLHTCEDRKNRIVRVRASSIFSMRVLKGLIELARTEDILFYIDAEGEGVFH